MMRCALLAALALVCTSPAAHGQSGQSRGTSAIDLLADAEAWSNWSARPEIAPRCERQPDGGPGGLPVLVVEGGGNPNACGCWRRPLPPLTKGHRYRVEAAFQCEGVAHPGHSIWAILTRGEREFEELVYRETRDGWHRLAFDLAADADGSELDLRLYLAWSPAGRVRWSDVRLSDVTEETRPRPVARLAAVSGRPKRPASPDECLDFYCDRLDEVGSRGVDLVCLPECINVDGIGGDTSKWAETIPGPSTRRLVDKACQHKMYVAASLLERDGPLIYNTGVLLDRAGVIVGKYRKTHPTIGESLLKGVRPGGEYPVFQTDFGRVGYVICFDNHYPEVARILAVKGAEVLVFSNMGDGREEGTLWEPYIRTRALDNQVHIVAAVNGGRSCVVSPRGEILSMTEKQPGEIAQAECNLDESVRNYSGRQIGKRYLQVRRADTFDPLTHHYWESLGFPADWPLPPSRAEAARAAR